MKKHWAMVLGASLLTGVAGSWLIQKKRTSRLTNSDLTELSELYAGHWWFVNQQKATQHTLTVLDNLTLSIDGKEIPYTLIELTTKRFAIQDEYGYHLIIQCLNDVPTSLYDEADDVTYSLEKIT